MGTMRSKLALLGKGMLHRFYSKDAEIRPFLPPTASFTRESAKHFLRNYGVVYIKSTAVHTGKGVIKAWKAGGGYRFVKVKGKVHSASSTADLHRKIKPNPKASFIIQKAIDLARIGGRPYDIRVMMMRDGERRWHYAGMLAKVAGKGSIVSNVNRGGGYATTIENALAKSLGYGPKRIRDTMRRLLALSSRIVAYSERYPFYSFQCGIDLAVDKQGRIWIIEVNLHNPSHGLFNRLSDKTFYRKIGRLYASYRRKNKRLM
ncbi:MAG: YheC/YheD family protein [Paenibacillaceae bacterium]|nr:YheC/YheD family protein [Paenibacillaceae bacterium]